MAASPLAVLLVFFACLAIAAVPGEASDELPASEYGASDQIWSLLRRRLWLASSRPSYNDCTNPHQSGTKPAPWSGQLDDFFKEYRPLEEISLFIAKLESTYPDFVKVNTIGWSWEGRPLKMMEITDYASGSAEEKPAIVIEGGIHAREWIAPATVLYLANALAQSGAGNHHSETKSLLQEFVVCIIAPLNPDGYVYTWEVDRMWRKTRSTRKEYRCSSTADGIGGVDANRNWGFSWGDTDDKAYERALHNPCTEVFIGPSEFSEPETNAISDYMRNRQETLGSGHVAAFLDYHAAAQMLLPPWAYLARAPKNLDGQYQTGLTHAMAAAMKGSSGRAFKAGADLFPADPGTGPDWAYGRLGVRATMTVELEGPRGRQLFCLPASEIRSVGEEQYAGLLALVAYIQKHGHEPVHRKRSLDIDGERPAIGVDRARSSTYVAALALAIVALFALAGILYQVRHWRSEKSPVVERNVELGLTKQTGPLE